jgi:hypothetical protein
MENLQRAQKVSVFFLVGFISLAAMLILAVANSATADYELPPRSTPISGNSIISDSEDMQGGRLFLRVHFSENWPWESRHWQTDLWHVVQWYDHEKTWREVEGWQGNLDTISQEGGWVGQKEFWIDESNLGGGPFRWMVYDIDGRLMATSPEFYLPSDIKGYVMVDLELEP